MLRAPHDRGPDAYLDCGANYHQMAPETIAQVGRGTPTMAKVKIVGVDPRSDLCAEEKWSARWPVGDGEVHDFIPLKEVPSGHDIKGPALLSLGRLTEEGFSFLFAHDSCWMYDPEMQLIMRVPRKDRLYPIPVSAHGRAGPGDLIEKDLLLRLLEAHEVRLREEEGETAEQKFGVTIRTGATDLTKSRHRAYGHSAMSGPLLQHLQAAHGDKIKAGVTNGHCNACIETRSHKRGKPTDSHHRRPAEVYLDRVHIDIKVIFGFPYLLVLDEALNLGKAILDTGKDRLVSGVIQHFKTEEIHARRRCRDLEVPGLRQLRMDGAKEFVHGDLEEYLNELGATRELRVAHDPEQSGRIEAFGHTVTSHVGAMLRGGGAPIEMTPFAVEHFTSFVHPRIPGQAKARGLRGEECFNTAYEAYHGVHIDPKVLDAKCTPSSARSPST